MKTILQLFVSLTLLVILSGCGSSGMFQANHVTNVELSQPNFNIVARDLQGSATQGYILGLSVPRGNDIDTFGLVRVSGTQKLFDTAIKALWSDYQGKHGSVEGKKLALINVRQDTEVLNTLIYTEAKIFITADVVEFVN